MIRVSAASTKNPSETIVKLTCPGCRHAGTFDPTGSNDLLVTMAPPHASAVANYVVGQRQCPDRDCRTHVFVVLQEVGGKWRLTESYPPILIDFDANQIPERVVEAVQEAIKCHSSGCNKAAAMMVRKSLEVLCEDRGAGGANLKERVVQLASMIVIPRDLVSGLDNLRLLGNDAAHVEAKAYDDIGSDEVETAIAFTKEVLKACFQYSALVARLQPKTTKAAT